MYAAPSNCLHSSAFRSNCNHLRQTLTSTLNVWYSTPPRHYIRSSRTNVALRAKTTIQFELFLTFDSQQKDSRTPEGSSTILELVIFKSHCPRHMRLILGLDASLPVFEGGITNFKAWVVVRTLGREQREFHFLEVELLDDAVDALDRHIPRGWRTGTVNDRKICNEVLRTFSWLIAFCRRVPKVTAILQW
ncbi:hypothetical protein FI667_g5691, partial [Globisporangium splendens]